MPNFTISEYFATSEVASGKISPLAKSSTNFRKFKWIRNTWSNSIGAEAYFIHFANSEIFGY